MKNYLFSLLFLSFMGCDLSKDQLGDPSTMELDLLWTQINIMATSENCINPKEWTFTAIGSKPCGGPMSYIAYSKKIDEKKFLEMVQHYSALQADFNKRTGAISDCALVQRPTGVICENSKAVLIY